MLAAACMMGDVMTEVLWNRMTAEELRQKAVDDAIVLLPVASTEQHGPHLATGVDAFLGGEGCLRTAKIVARNRPIVVAPVVWMGLAEHHVAFWRDLFTLTLDVSLPAQGTLRFNPAGGFQENSNRQFTWRECCSAQCYDH